MDGSILIKATGFLSYEFLPFTSSSLSARQAKNIIKSMLSVEGEMPNFFGKCQNFEYLWNSFISKYNFFIFLAFTKICG
jgi:hypothetical protein